VHRDGGMAGNVLWTTIFNKPTSQASELTRQRIVQEERCGRRPASIISGPAYEDAVRGRGPLTIADPWAPPRDRHALPAPIKGYGGTMPRVRQEHTGKNYGEQAAQFKAHFGTDRYQYTQNMAPGGGASALGTKPMPIPGSKTPVGPRIYESLLEVRAADPIMGKAH